MFSINPYQPLVEHQQLLCQYQACAAMIPPVIVGEPVLTPILSLGQAPGIHEGEIGRPFGLTAGRTLFKWFESIGVDEATYRRNVYMCAVCRCFPGRNHKGGDRVPDRQEIANCAHWLQTEIGLLQPQLIILIGKLAIQQFLPVSKLDAVVGRLHTVLLNEREVQLAPLPHPSGLSTWFRTEPGKTLLNQSLIAIQAHPAWQNLMKANK